MISIKRGVVIVQNVRLVVRGDGRVVVAGLLVGHVRRLETGDGFCWFWSRDGFQNDAHASGRQRRNALQGLLRALVEAARA